MNKFERFLGRISDKTCLKVDYLGSKSSQIAKRWGIRLLTPLPPATGGFIPQPPFRLNN